MAEAERDIKAFNKKYPELEITKKAIMKSFAQRRTNSANSENGIIIKPKLKESLNAEKFI